MSLLLQSPEPDLREWQARQASLAVELLGRTYAQCRASGLDLPDKLLQESQDESDPSFIPAAERDRLVLVGITHDEYTFRWDPRR